MSNRAAAVFLAAVAVTIATPHAAAEPGAPQQDTPCRDDLRGTLTQLPDQKTIVQCQDAQGESRWRAFPSPYPESDRWLTYGPLLTLHGEGQPNREVDSGEWMAHPQEPDAQCEARQRAVVAAGVLSQVQTSSSKPGQPMTFDLQPLLFTVELRGHCLWQKVH